MSKRFLDVFLVSFLYSIIMMIIIAFLYYLGINLIGDVVATILLAGVISILISNTICKQFIYVFDLKWYNLGFTEAGIKYRRKILDIMKEFENHTFEMYDKTPKTNPKTYEELYSYLYLLSYVKSRNEIIKKITTAFDDVDNFSEIDIIENDTK